MQSRASAALSSPDRRQIGANPAICPVCGGERLRPGLRQVPELRFGLVDRFDIARCLSCGTYVTLPQPSPEYLEQLYEQHYVQPEYVPPDARAIADLVADLQSGGTLALDRWRQERSTEVPAIFLSPPFNELFRNYERVLDVGAYTGENMLWLQAAGWRPTGVEPNPVAARMATEAGLDIRNGYLEACALPDASFDAAYLSYVIEHLPRPIEMLRELHRLLRPGGRLLLTTHNVHSLWRFVFGKYWINWHTPFHLYHPHPAALRALAERAGFKALALHTRTPVFWFLMSLRAMRDDLRSGRPNRALYTPVADQVNRRIRRVLRVEDIGAPGDCIIGIFERAA